MTSETPGPGTPGWGEPPSQDPPAAAAPGEWPKELVPPGDTPPPAVADSQPAPASTWGQPAAPAPAEPAAPAPATTWGQPAAAPVPTPTEPVPTPAAPAAPTAPAGSTWGQPAAPVAQPMPDAAPAPGGQWGAPPPQQPQPAQPVNPGPPVQPQAPGYGAPVAPGAAPGGQWGAPPPQQPGGWAPPPGSPGSPGAPGGPPVGWQPAPAKSSNGCLKACLIVGIILVILAVVGIVAVTLLGMKFASDMGINPDGTVEECSFVSNAELAQVLEGQPTGMPLGGFVDATLGQLLDKRLLTEAQDCWLVDESTSSGYTGRMALQEGGSFDQEQAAAQSGGFYATEIPGFGDQAFCTGMAETGSTGALVRVGGNLAYVSLISGDVEGFDFSEAPNGVLYSPSTCEQAAAIAAQILR